MEIAQIKITASERFGQKASVKRFLPTEADAKQFIVRELQETFWSQRIYCRLQPCKRGPRGSQRDLLLENDENERGEARFTYPERRLAVSFNHGGQMLIPAR